MRLPGPSGRIALAGAIATWSGALLGLEFGFLMALPLVGAAVAAGVTRRVGIAALLLMATAGVGSGSAAAERVEATLNAEVPEGPISVVGRVTEDGNEARPGIVVPESARAGPPLSIELAAGDRLVAGERVRIDGSLRHAPGWVRGDPVAGRLRAERIERIEPAGPLLAVGNAVRARVLATAGGEDPGRSLLRGFLIGDTSTLASRDLEALRRSGLTHFVAVSGSNVALFLAGWWVVTAPFGLGSRRRFALGLIGLAIFVVVTRWEGSVLRAAAMAGLMLGGAAAGVVVDGWMALGAAVTGLILLTGHLAVDVGFQLSVAATAGILLGAGSPGRRRPRWAWTVLAATASAQLAVLPILLWHFGSVPLFAPLANLVAAPLVSVATIAGALGVISGSGALVALGARLAGLVLTVADLAASWPQLGVGAVLVLGSGGALAAFRRLRPVVTVAGAAAVAVITLGIGVAPVGETVTFLDVGQGDAVLIRSNGMAALVDGGRDPLLLEGRLRSHGIGRIDLLVVTHGDLDHVGGLDGILSGHGVGRLWVPAFGSRGDVLDELVAAARAAGIGVEAIGARSPPVRIGAVTVQPLGPARRYATDNDGSIVLWVEARRSLLLAGDIESIAQRELPEVRPDVLLVPHHGSATTDVAWLEQVLGRTAVVSVGENRYGHPAPEIMAVLELSGAAVLTTAEDGDVLVRLG